jgi:putative ABC transport system permease protein
MIRNHLIIALRTLLKQKGYAAINVIGLALGLTAGICILLYVVDEYSYDTMHTKADRAYRVTSEFVPDGQTPKGSGWQQNAWPLGTTLLEEFPEVEAISYLTSAGFFTVFHQEKRIPQQIIFADTSLFQIFNFPLQSGDARTALARPYTVVITEEMAEKYFPGEDALHKDLILGDSIRFQVTGIAASLPENTHLQFEILVSFETFIDMSERITGVKFGSEEGWGNFNLHTYLLLKEGVNHADFKAKSASLYMDKKGEMYRGWNSSIEVVYEPLADVYLRSKAGNSFGPKGDIERVYLVLGISFFVILLSCINFVNLATARATHRAKEVGIRKVSGSGRRALIFQFLSESWVLTSLAFVFALFLTAILLPFFNEIIQKQYSLSTLLAPHLVGGMAGLVVLISLLAGFYPSLVLSGMQPVAVLKGKFQNSRKGVQLRRGLVVLQFVVSVALVLGTFVVLDQLHFMQKENLGFHKDEVLVVRTGRAPSSSLQAFKQEVLKMSGVQEASLTNVVPGRLGWAGQIAFAEERPDDAKSVEYMVVDEDYVRVFGLEVLAGRNFDADRQMDLKEGLVLNEEAVRIFGWESPEEAIGKRIVSPSEQPAGVVIGVVKNYHHRGLKEQIGPLVMDVASFSGMLAIRYQAAQTADLIQSVETLWKSTYEGRDFSMFFLNEDFERQYHSELRLARVFGFFAFITILISTIGLLGLVSYMIEVRTKEIGIRKVLGGGVLTIARTVSSEFLWLVVLANAIAIPLVWYFGSQWLQSFAYRIDLQWISFVLAVGVTLVVTLITVGGQAIRAGRMNPVNSLRSE